MQGSAREFMNEAMPQFGNKGVPAGRTNLEVSEELQQKIVNALKAAPNGIRESDMLKLMGVGSITSMTRILNSLLPRYLVFEDNVGRGVVYFLDDQEEQ